MYCVSSFTIGLCVVNSQVFAAEIPNIVWVICDSFGYGDVQCLNPKEGRIPTPQLDRLTSEGWSSLKENQVRAGTPYAELFYMELVVGEKKSF